VPCFSFVLLHIDCGREIELSTYFDVQIATVSRSSGKCIEEWYTRGRDSVVDALETEVLDTYKRLNKGRKWGDEVKCGLFDGASRAVAGIGKRKGSYKRKKDKQKSQPIPSDATRYAI
jgi:hypothetical protein